MRVQIVAVLGTIGLVAACQAPAPEPVTVEPIYTGKYGEAVMGQCREPDQPVTSAFPSTLPLCSDYCGPGSSYVGGSNLAGMPQCVPYYRPNEERDPDPGDTQRDPTGRPN